MTKLLLGHFVKLFAIFAAKSLLSRPHTHTHLQRVCRGHTNQINELAQLEASSNRGEDKERGRLLTSRVLNMEYACQNTNNKEGESGRGGVVKRERSSAC